MEELASGNVIPTPRRYWTIEEKRQIMEEAQTLGISVTALARQRGINANQLFYWRKLYRAGQLGGVAHLLPVYMSDADTASITAIQETEQGQKPTGLPAFTMHIELPGRALISLEGVVDAIVVCAVLESLRA